MSDSTTKECIINGVQFKCRTCFDPGNPISSLTEKYDSTKTWLQLLNDIAQLKINNEELLPKTICCKCVDKLSSYYNFLLQIENVNNKYSEMLTNLSNTIQENIPSHFECLAESGSIVTLVTEIKLEDERVVPFDIALDSSNLRSLPIMNKERNDFENEDACDPFPETYNEKLVNFENQKRYLDEETEDAYTNALNENSSSCSEYLPEKKRKKDERNKNTRSPQEGKKSVWGRFQCNTCKSFCPSLSALRHHAKAVHSSLTSSSEGEEDLLPISKSFERNTRKKYPEWFKFIKIGKRFICPLCAKSFAQYRNCRRHVLTVHCRKKNLFPCGFCNYNGSSKTYLYAHIKRQHPEETFDANTKRIVFRFGDRIYNKPAPWRLAECKLCNTTFFKTKELRQHLASHCDTGTLDSLQLNSSIIQRWFSEMDLTCAKEIISKNIREKEWSRYYTVLNKFSYEVSISDTEVEELEDKVAERLKKYNCELCGKDFTFKYQLYSHMKKVHSNDEIPFKCRRCKLEFVSLDMYEQHRQTHCRNEYKTFQCSYCPGKFVYENHMKRHYCITQVPSSDSDSETVVLSEYLKDVEASLEAEINMEHSAESSKKSKNPDQFNTLIDSTSLSSKLEENDSTKLDVEVLNSDQTTYQEPPVAPIRELSISENLPSDTTRTIQYCYLCPKSFFTTNDVNDHLSQHRMNPSTITTIKSLAHSTWWPNGKKVINCKICDLEFTSMAKLKEHFSPNNPSSKCAGLQSLENYSITNQRGFELHLELDSETESESDAKAKQYENLTNLQLDECQKCKKSFKRKYQFAQHQRSAHPYKLLKFKCECCVFKTCSQKVLDHHKATQCLNVEKKHFCRQCNFRFMWQENLANHISIFHKSNNEETKIDSAKSESVRDGDATLQPASKKQRPSSRRVSCPICGIFMNAGSLPYHTMRHNGEKPFKCKFCEMSFTRNSYLVEHNLKHTSEGPFKCTICDKSFKNHIHLRHHLSLHNNELPYKCNLCSAAFTQSEQLKRHLLGHPGIKPHKCKLCDKGFLSNYELVKHREKSGHN